jgi:HlyD family secretion protein
VLVVLDKTLIEAQLGQLDARVAEAKAAVADAEARSRRADALERAGATSSADRETLSFGLESARAALQASMAQQAELRTRLERLTIRAPAAGRVIERNVWTGEIAGAGAPMLRIAIDDEIELDAEVPEHELSRLRVGGAAKVVLPSGETVPGEIRRIDPDVDPTEKLGRARIALPSHPGLRSGGFARALIGHDERSSPMAPEAALRFSTDGESVLTVDDDGIVRSVRVKTGARSGGLVELLEGPVAGERVIVGGAAFVLEGDAVEAIETDAFDTTAGAAAAEDAASR